jgi:hypothetical protein
MCLCLDLYVCIHLAFNLMMQTMMFCLPFSAHVHACIHECELICPGGTVPVDRPPGQQDVKAIHTTDAAAKCSIQLQQAP